MKRRIFILNLLIFMETAMITIKPALGVTSPSKIIKTDEEWHAILSAEQYHVLRQEGTEQAFSSPLNAEKRNGSYHCAGCQLELFTSEMKYDSGTGWPSFFTSITEHIATKTDFHLVWPRTEYHCAQCGGHQGHLFDDGPHPTQQRWCNNGLALHFIPREPT